MINELKFMLVAAKEAIKSTSVLRKTGAVLVKNNKIILKAHNEILQGSNFRIKNDTIREKLELKGGEYPLMCDTIHAETSIIAEAAAKGTKTKGAELYTTSYPCQWCAKTLVAAGIKKIFFIDPHSTRDAVEILHAGSVATKRLNLPSDNPKKRLKYLNRKEFEAKNYKRYASKRLASVFQKQTQSRKSGV